MTRRRLLVWLATATWASGGLARATFAHRQNAHAAAIGRRYLASAPRPAEVRTLVSELTAAPGPNATHRAARRVDPRIALLGRRVIDDYTAGRTLEVDGWVLSRTEVALGVLAALG